MLGGIELDEDLKGGTAEAPEVSGLHLTADTAINHKLTAVTDPTEAQDAATKKYVDNKAAGLSWKTPAALATTAALPANTVAGETITGTEKVNLELDGSKIEVGQRILVKNQVATKTTVSTKSSKKVAPLNFGNSNVPRMRTQPSCLRTLRSLLKKVRLTKALSSRRRLR